MSEPNTPQTPPPDVFAMFVGEINQASVKLLVNSIALVSQHRAPRLHLLLQSTGGTVSEGVYLYNFLRTLPVPLTIYNGGQVCSAAVLAYLAVAERRVSETGSFMIHRCQSSPMGANPTGLAAAVDSLAIDDARMDGILKEHLALSEDRWARYDYHALWLSADDAIEAGLATGYGDFSPPLGQPVFAFG